MDPEIGEVKGKILVENGEIKALGENISVPSGITEIDGTNAIVMPGLIDCHWHMWTPCYAACLARQRIQVIFP
jgi:5-methylthioadenosine/S-adenosylhomocysteine deaminase